MEIVSFDPVKIGAIVAVITVVVQTIKTILERLEAWTSAPGWLRSVAAWWAHSQGPVIISVVVALFTITLPEIVADGSLSWPELRLILEAVGLAGAANAVYWVSRLKTPLSMFKKHKPTSK